MRLVRNLLALVGLLTLVTVGFLILAFEPYVNKARSLDDGALAVYAAMAQTVLETGDSMEAMVYRRRVVAEYSVAEVQERLEQASEALGLNALGAPLAVHEQVLVERVHRFPLLQVYLFCDPRLAADLIRHNPAMAAFLPCRIILHQDDQDRLWLMTPNLDLVLHGGRPLPILLRERAQGLQATLRAMVDQAAGHGE